jgi:hypothetical protein
MGPTLTRKAGKIQWDMKLLKNAQGTRVGAAESALGNISQTSVGACLVKLIPNT